MVCCKCGKEIDATAKFCKYCGNPTETVIEPVSNKNSSVPDKVTCGAENLEDQEQSVTENMVDLPQSNIEKEFTENTQEEAEGSKHQTNKISRNKLVFLGACVIIIIALAFATLTKDPEINDVDYTYKISFGNGYEVTDIDPHAALDFSDPLFMDAVSSPYHDDSFPYAIDQIVDINTFKYVDITRTRDFEAFRDTYQVEPVRILGVEVGKKISPKYYISKDGSMEMILDENSKMKSGQKYDIEGIMLGFDAALYSGKIVLANVKVYKAGCFMDGDYAQYRIVQSGPLTIAGDNPLTHDGLAISDIAVDTTKRNAVNEYADNPVDTPNISYSDFVGEFLGDDENFDVLQVELVGSKLEISCYGYRVEYFTAEVDTSTELDGYTISFQAYDPYVHDTYDVTLTYIPAEISSNMVDTIYMEAEGLFNMGYVRTSNGF